MYDFCNCNIGKRIQRNVREFHSACVQGHRQNNDAHSEYSEARVMMDGEMLTSTVSEFSGSAVAVGGLKNSSLCFEWLSNYPFSLDVMLLQRKRELPLAMPLFSDSSVFVSSV